jgi:hypothetical protein
MMKLCDTKQFIETRFFNLKCVRRYAVDRSKSSVNITFLLSIATKFLLLQILFFNK